jgi:hypothetical protein
VLEALTSSNRRRVPPYACICHTDAVTTGGEAHCIVSRSPAGDYRVREFVTVRRGNCRDATVLRKSRCPGVTMRSYAAVTARTEYSGSEVYRTRLTYKARACRGVASPAAPYDLSGLRGRHSNQEQSDEWRGQHRQLAPSKLRDKRGVDGELRTA